MKTTALHSIARIKASGQAMLRALALSWTFTTPFNSNVYAGTTAILDSPEAYGEPNLIGVNPFPGNRSPSVFETLYSEESLTRIDDSVDQLWTADPGARVHAVAKFGAAPLTFGTFTGGQPLEGLFSTSSFDYNVSGGSLFPQELMGSTFALGLLNELDDIQRFYSSIAAQNEGGRDGQDRSVTFLITSNDGRPGNPTDKYIVAWEDGNDFDYQDLVVELVGVHPIPEPASALLLMIGMGAIAGRRRTLIA